MGLGLHHVGFEVVGVDLRPQPEYPGKTVTADVLALDPEWVATFDLVWGSPPCQFASSTRNLYDPQGVLPLPDLVGPTRDLLEAAGRPYVIENVPGAGLRADVLLCGRMFRLGVVRHREFELGGWAALQPAHHERCRGREDTVTVAGGGASRRGFVSVAAARAAIGAPHLRTRWAIDQAVPPAYAAWLGSQWVAWAVSSGAGVVSLLDREPSPAGGVAPPPWWLPLAPSDSLVCRCGAPLISPSERGGRPPKHCSKACRQAAWRESRRQAS